MPIWWGVEIKSGGVGEATIVVSNAKPYRGTKRSVQELSTFTSKHPVGAVHHSVIDLQDHSAL